MTAPVFSGLKREGRAFLLEVVAPEAPSLVLVRNKTGDCRKLPRASSQGDRHRFLIDFYGSDLYDIVTGLWRVYADLAGERIGVTVDKPWAKTMTFAGYSYGISATREKGLSIKVAKAYGALENTHEKRTNNAHRAYRMFRRLPLKPKKVLFESLSTHVFNDNPKAIYEELRMRDLGYEIIWALENEKTPIGEGGKAVRYYTLEYWYHLATAKYIVSNYNQLKAVKRAGQVFVQTMHGTPLKKMGLSVTKNKDKYARMKSLFEDDWDYFVTPSDFFSDILRGPSYGFTGEFLEVGYPRNDFLVNNRDNAQLIDNVRRELGVPDGKKMILYAPTWRTKKRFDLKLDLAAMEAALGDEYVLVLRSHYLEQEFVPADVYGDFVLDGHAYANVNDMLIAADVLVTDYSSIMFDYAIMNRPLLLFTWDYNRYVGKKRGTYFDLKEEYPEIVAMTSEELVEKFSHLDDVMTCVQSFHERFNQYEKGTASRDVVDRLFA